MEAARLASSKLGPPPAAGPPLPPHTLAATWLESRPLACLVRPFTGCAAWLSACRHAHAPAEFVALLPCLRSVIRVARCLWRRRDSLRRDIDYADSANFNGNALR